MADDPSTDFKVRNQDLLRAVAPAPNGDEAPSEQDLASPGEYGLEVNL